MNTMLAAQFCGVMCHETGETRRHSEVLEELVKDRMTSGNYESAEEVLRDSLEALLVEEEELRLIEEVLDDVGSGYKGVMLDEAFASLRAMVNIPADA